MKRTFSDLLRVISIFFVIAIHATGAAEVIFNQTKDFFSTSFLGVLLNQLSRFSVPVFLFLSGYGLSQKYKNNTTFPYREFYISRLYKIALPYIFWSFVFLFFRADGFRLPTGESNNVWFFTQMETYGKFLILGRADYHFYFFSIILQCYLLFPFLLKLRKKYWILAFLLTHFLFTAPAHLYFASAGIKRPSFFSAFFIYWIFFFFSGIGLSHFQNQVNRFIYQLPKKLIYLFFILSFALILGEYIIHSYNDSTPGNYNHFSRQSVALYFFSFVTIAIYLSEKTKEEHFYFFSISIEKLAGLSFFVYIFHTWILRAINFVSSSFLLSFPLTLFLTFTIGYFLSKIIKTKIIRIILGLPAK